MSISRGYKTAIDINRTQNQADFEINPDELPIIFKKGLFSKTLEPLNPDPTMPRTVIVKCLYTGCSKVYKGQKVNHSTSNYITHYRNNHKAFNIQRYLMHLDPEASNSDLEEAFSQGSSSSQATIIQAFSKLKGSKRPASLIKEPFNIKKFKWLLMRFIIENNISFRGISSNSFRELTNYLNDEAPLLYNKVLHEDLEAIYKERKDMIQAELTANIESKGYFSLTLDAWTAINQDAYLGVTIHYINSNSKLKSHAIAMAYLNQPHSGKYMFKVLSKALIEYGIQDKITSITRDNASSNDTLIEAFRRDYSLKGFKFEGDIACLAHVLNLVVQDILKAIIKDAYNELDNNKDIFNIENDLDEEISNNISLWKKIRTIIIGLKYSGENNRALKRQIEALKISNPRFPQLDQKTRWSSTANMLRNFLNIWPAIEVVISRSETKSFKKYRSILLLKESEITYLNKCLRIFDIFVKATTKLQAEKYPTIYYLLPEVYKIYNKLEAIRDEFNSEPFTSAINKGIAKLRKYYPKTGITNNNKALYLSLLLDPRIKSDGLSLLGLSNSLIIDINQKLKDEYEFYKREHNIELPEVHDRVRLDQEDLDIYIDEDEEEFDELQSYLEERRSNFKIKPLDYWANNKDKYAVLSILVRKYLQVPATSAPSERFFSIGALIINKLRNRLSKDTFEMISLLKSWGFIIDNKEKEALDSTFKVANPEENIFIID